MSRVATPPTSYPDEQNAEQKYGCEHECDGDSQPMVHVSGHEKRHEQDRCRYGEEWKEDDQENVEWKSSVHCSALHLTRRSSATAGGSELSFSVFYFLISPL